jgi:hypothetical protein
MLAIVRALEDAEIYHASGLRTPGINADWLALTSPLALSPSRFTI